MKDYTLSSAEFNETIQIPETTDTNHADNINYAPKQIFENTVYLKNAIDEVTDVADSLDSDTTYTHGISGGIPYILISGGSESDKVYLITQAMKEGTYDGRNLAEVFDSEIAQYSDEWEWIKDRIDSGYLCDLFTCDYIPIETTDGHSFDMQIMGINTYTGYGSTEIGNMIDFCSRTVHPTSTYFNSSNNNNGSTDNANPFMASYLKTTFLDTVVYPTLPSALTAQISAKHQYIESRYSASSTLTDSTAQTWQDIDGLWVPSEMEVTGHFGWGTQGYSHEGHIQYPYFVHMHNRAKKIPAERAAAGGLPLPDRAPPRTSAMWARPAMPAITTRPTALTLRSASASPSRRCQSLNRAICGPVPHLPAHWRIRPCRRTTISLPTRRPTASRDIPRAAHMPGCAGRPYLTPRSLPISSSTRSRDIA